MGTCSRYATSTHQDNPGSRYGRSAGASRAGASRPPGTGALKTLCGRLAVTELSPFAAATPNRCRTCYSKVDDEGMLDQGAQTSIRRKRPANKK